MLFVLVLLASIVIASFFGHVIHWALHQKWTGLAHRGHMEHHEELYPVGDLISDKYRASKWYHNGVLLFTPPLFVIMAFFALILLLVHAPLWILCVLGPTLVGYGLMNDYFHDSFHLKKNVFNRFKWYKRLRKIHFRHHVDMSVNYGIILFVWDKVFGTADVS